MPYSSYSTRICVKDSAGSTWYDLDGPLEVPDNQGFPESIDVTSVRDAFRKKVFGLRVLEPLQFRFSYDPAVGAPFRVLRAFQASATVLNVRIEYPDGMLHAFTALVAVKTEAGKTGGILAFVAEFLFQTDLVVTNPVAPATAPTITATAGVGQVTVGWAAITNATRYEVYVSPTSGGTYVLVGESANLSLVVTGLAAGVIKYFKVKAVSNAGATALSSAASATPT